MKKQQDIGPWDSSAQPNQLYKRVRPFSLIRSVKHSKQTTPIRLKTQTFKSNHQSRSKRAMLKLKRLRYPQNLYQSTGVQLQQVRKQNYKPQLGSVHNNWQRRVTYLKAILGSRDMNIKNELAILNQNGKQNSSTTKVLMSHKQLSNKKY